MEIKNKIICGDSIEVLKQIKDNTFDFVFADPPYFLQLEKNKVLLRVEVSKFNGCDDEWINFL